MASKLLFDGSDWNFETISNTIIACGEIAKELKLSTYKNQIEVITSEQMLDAYASVGLPIMYKHWSFGKRFSKEKDLYKQGKRGLAYEIVINSDPCISYLMEENTACTQTLVIAHAAFGHNHFFKNNYLFRQWTDATSIVDYLIFAKNYIEQCEEKYGEETVRELLDGAHALMMNGIDRAKRPTKLSLTKEKQKQAERQAYLQETVNDLWRTLPKSKKEKVIKDDNIFPPTMQENILYFLEKHSPKLESWEREVLRIVRKLSQYFYPQYQTKVMNEGWASFTHYYIMNRLWETGQINEGSMLEFLQLHTSVLWQPEFDSPYYSGMNPYYLGFEMFHDIKRICTTPTEEDREWFPNIVDKNWIDVCLDAVANYRDESFIRQFLSPTLIRKLKLFIVTDISTADHYTVNAIHDSLGYKIIREQLANSYEIDDWCPQIAVTKADIKGTRELSIRYKRINGRSLNQSWKQVAMYIHKLWGYPVNIETDDGAFLGTVQ